ncbi:hypothetical protein LSH36_418g02090 [Paralvinella palmiformis]|uniref:Uncharacterized protein n=1 Tax=Paralvinella palmiformis TaxID=53620 RepID=A0AAD9MYJ9_9ANNE|nr:hypothetical protein LSH36_418g02090 [Paralvinella palmiformis]
MSGTRSRCCAIRRCENLEPCRSWLALVAVLLTNMLLNLADSFGVYYDALVDKYDASRAAVGWIFSIRWTFIFLAGGFISPFIDIYGCRPVAMTFALLYAVATTLSAFAPTIGSLYFIYSALTEKVLTQYTQKLLLFCLRDTQVKEKRQTMPPPYLAWTSSD